MLDGDWTRFSGSQVDAPADKAVGDLQRRSDAVAACGWSGAMELGDVEPDDNGAAAGQHSDERRTEAISNIFTDDDTDGTSFYRAPENANKSAEGAFYLDAGDANQSADDGHRWEQGEDAGRDFVFRPADFNISAASSGSDHGAFRFLIEASDANQSGDGGQGSDKEEAGSNEFVFRPSDVADTSAGSSGNAGFQLHFGAGDDMTHSGDEGHEGGAGFLFHFNTSAQTDTSVDNGESGFHFTFGGGAGDGNDSVDERNTGFRLF